MAETTRLDLTLKEYDGVFTELRQCLTLQYTILGGGIALVATIMRELFIGLSGAEVAPSTVALGALLTGATDLVIAAWAGEVTRMRRNAVYLIALEKDLLSATSTGTALPHALLPRFGFHTWAGANGGQGQLRLHYVLTLGILILVGVIGLVPLMWSGLGEAQSTATIPSVMPVRQLSLLLGIVATIGHVVIVTLVVRRLNSSELWPT